MGIAMLNEWHSQFSQNAESHRFTVQTNNKSHHFDFENREEHLDNHPYQDHQSKDLHKLPYIFPPSIMRPSLAVWHADPI